jgi:hypothetical protein
MNVRSIFVASVAVGCALTLFAHGGQRAAEAARGMRVVRAADGQSLLLPVEGGTYLLRQSVASLSVFPQPAALNNPTSPSGNTGAQTFTVTVKTNGSAMERRPSGSSSVTVSVYGPPGAVTPTSQSVPLNGNAATATFTYNGTYFQSPMTVAATLDNGSMTAPIFLSNALPCTYGNGAAYKVHETNPLKYGPSGGFHLRMSVAGGEVRGVQLDTGSTGFLIAASALAKSNKQEMVGPGQIGFETLEPSGITLVGHYWLAPVTLIDPGQDKTIDQTIPMEILSVEFSCAPSQPCQPETKGRRGTALMGVGFGRPTPPPGQVYIKTPLENVFLQLQDVVEGNVQPGYILANDHLWLGLNHQDTRNFKPSSFVQLQPDTDRPGDWNGPPGCLNFNGSGFQCGSLLVDIGIDSILASGFTTPSPLTQVNVVAPNPSQAALAYGFPYPVPSDATPPAPDPNGIAQGQAIEWIPAPGSTPFVNVGRDPIAAADYLYDSGCGLVGFGTPSKSGGPDANGLTER